MANFLNTRIRLKYDTFTAWEAKDPTLLAGEVAIVVPGDKLADVNTGVNDAGAKVPCLMKVGDGSHTFKQLPWLSALAADVHTWAKMGESEFKAWLASANGAKLATKEELETLSSSLSGEIGAVNTALTTYKNTLGFDTPAEGKTVQGVIAETYATKTEVNTLDTKVGYTGTDKTLVEFIADTYATQTSVTTAITTEKDRAEAAESALSTAIATEKTRAEGAEQALGQRIDALAGTGEGSVDARIKAAIDKEVEDRDAAILVETNARKGEITRVEGLISAEASRAAGVEQGLDGRIEAIEKDYLKAADKTELQGNIDTLTGVVETLRDGVDADKVDGIKDLIDYVETHGPEVTEMQNDIKANTTAIESEAARAAGAEAAEAQAREAADTALGKRIDDANTALNNYKAEIGFTKTDDNKTLVETIAATYATQTDLEGAVEDINDLIEGINSNASGLEGRVKANEDKLAGLATATVAGDIAAAEGRAATDAQTKATKAKDDAIAAAATDATTKANQALADAKTYTDGEIDKVESTIADIQSTAITGTKTGDVLTLALNGVALDIIFCCGSATENI